MSVEDIDFGAFAYCTSLTNVVLGDGIEQLYDYAFAHCTNLTNVVLGDGLRYIIYSAFEDCVSLSFNEYAGAKYLGTESNPYFYLFDSQDLSEIHRDTKVIGDYALRNDSLTTLNIPDSVIYINSDLIASADSLTSIEVDSKNQYYKSVDGVLYSGDGKTLVKYPGNKEGTSFTVPIGVTTIQMDANDNKNLKEITIPATVSSIRSWCLPIGLETITFLGTVKQWEELDFDFYTSYNLTINCIDGQITIVEGKVVTE